MRRFGLVFGLAVTSTVIGCESSETGATRAFCDGDDDCKRGLIVIPRGRSVNSLGSRSMIVEKWAMSALLDSSALKRSPCGRANLATPFQTWA